MIPLKDREWIVIMVKKINTEIYSWGVVFEDLMIWSQFRSENQNEVKTNWEEFANTNNIENWKYEE